MTTIPAGSRGFDALGDPAPPSVLYADGWRFRTFYITPTRRADGGKINLANITEGKRRIQAHLDAGIGVLLNFEQEAEGWQGGAAEGRVDGAVSAQIAGLLGYPSDLPILVSWDTGIPTSQMPTAEAYGWAFAEGCAPWPIGVYGGTPIIARMELISRLGWRAMASSWSPPGVNATVHWRQRRPSVSEQQRYPYVGTPTSWRLDVNDALLPFDAWTANHVPPIITNPDFIDPSEEDTVQFNYNNMILDASGHAIRRVIHGGVVDLGPTPKPVTREVLVALVGQLFTAGPSPFGGGGELEAYRDAELDAIWKSRPQLNAPVQVVGSGNPAPVVFDFTGVATPRA